MAECRMTSQVKLTLPCGTSGRRSSEAPSYVASEHRLSARAQGRCVLRGAYSPLGHARTVSHVIINILP